MELKERIVELSMKLFFEQGIRSVRMDDIAQLLGISKRTIYEIFEDKESLILEGLKYHAHKVRQNQIKVTRDADNVIEHIFLLLRDWQQSAEHAHRFMISIRRYYPAVYKEFSLLNARIARGDLRQNVELGIKQGVLLPNLNYEFASSVFRAIIEKVLFDQTTELPKGMDVGKAFEQILICYLRGLSTDKGIKLIDKYLINI